MTIISTHRIHTYKASASPHRRDLSPKKVFIQKTNNIKKYHNKITKTNTHQTQTADLTHLLQTLMTSITNYSSYFYTNIEEETVEEEFDEDTYEEMWAHHDYLEWLFD